MHSGCASDLRLRGLGGFCQLGHAASQGECNNLAARSQNVIVTSTSA